MLVEVYDELKIQYFKTASFIFDIIEKSITKVKKKWKGLIINIYIPIHNIISR